MISFAALSCIMIALILVVAVIGLVGLSQQRTDYRGRRRH